jgi:hypothetical protein
MKLLVFVALAMVEVKKMPLSGCQTAKEAIRCLTTVITVKLYLSKRYHPIPWGGGFNLTTHQLLCIFSPPGRDIPLDHVATASFFKVCSITPTSNFC